MAAELARREGLGGVVTGEVAGVGRGYVLTARVQATADGAMLAAFRRRRRTRTGCSLP